MSTALPQPMSDYFVHANAGNAPAAAKCFGLDGSVLDEGKTLTGRAAIAHWLYTSRQAYNAHLTPLRTEGSAGSPLVHVEVEGNFPGSPLVLKFQFRLADKLIRQLEITS